MIGVQGEEPGLEYQPTGWVSMGDIVEDRLEEEVGVDSREEANIDDQRVKLESRRKLPTDPGLGLDVGAVDEPGFGGRMGGSATSGGVARFLGLEYNGGSRENWSCIDSIKPKRLQPL